MSNITTLHIGGTGGPSVDTITGNSGGAVGPDLITGNINVLGSGIISVAGTPGTNTLTISAAGSGLLTWTTRTLAAAIDVTVNTGWACNVVAPFPADLTLPAVCAVGDSVSVMGIVGSGGWILRAAAGQRIYIDNIFTNIAGYLQPVNVTGSVTVTCIVANTTWSVSYAVGNLGVF